MGGGRELEEAAARRPAPGTTAQAAPPPPAGPPHRPSAASLGLPRGGRGEVVRRQGEEVVRRMATRQGLRRRTARPWPPPP